MSPHVSSVDAKLRELPKSDLYRGSHILYFDDLHRDWSAVRLNIEAYKAFSDTIEVSQREALAEHRAAQTVWIAKGGLSAGIKPPWSSADHDTMEYHNYENLKIACGFELHLKARLLARDFMVHQLDGSVSAYNLLAKEQRDRPVTRAEVLAIDDFRFDGNENYLPGLKASSLKFSWLTDKPFYRDAVGLSERDLNIASDFRRLRNQIHLTTGDIVETPTLFGLGVPLIQYLLPFLNREIVGWSNTTIASRGFNFKPLPEFR